MNTKNKTFANVVAISFGLHAIALFAVGGISLYNVIVPDEVAFEAMEAVETPKKNTHKVRLQKKQMKSIRVQPFVRKNQSVSNLNLENIDVKVPKLTNNVNVEAHVGGSSGGGLGSKALELSRSEVNFFGIKSQGENVVFIVDVARSMLEPSRGDVEGFARVKSELVAMIERLRPGTLFNVYAFSNGLDVFSQMPAAATEKQKRLAAEWIDRYWRYDGLSLTGSAGIQLRNYIPDFSGYPIRRNEVLAFREESKVKLLKNEVPKVKGRDAGVGTSRLDMALFAAFERRADTIFLITDGTPEVAYEYSREGLEEYRKKMEKWFKRGGEDSIENRVYKKALDEYYKQVARYQQKRLDKGLPLEVNEHGEPGGIKKPAKPKGIARPEYNPMFSPKELITMLNQKAEQEYKTKARRDFPSLHIVGYSADAKSEEYLRSIQRKFPNSRFKRIGERGGRG